MADEQGVTQFTPGTSAGTASANVVGPIAEGFGQGVKLAAIQEATQNETRKLDLADQQHKADLLGKAIDHLTKAASLKGPARNAVFRAAQQGLALNGITLNSDAIKFLDPETPGMRDMLMALSMNKRALTKPEIVAQVFNAFQSSGADMLAKSEEIYKGILADQSEEAKTNYLYKLQGIKGAQATNVATIGAESRTGLESAKNEARLGGLLTAHSVVDADGNPDFQTYHSMSPDNPIKKAIIDAYGVASGGRFSQPAMEYRADRVAKQKLIDKLDNNPSLKKLFEQAVGYSNALRTVDSADIVGPQQIHEFQQAIRSNLVKGPGSEAERAKTYINSLGMNWANVKQFITGNPVDLSRDSKLMAHFKNIAHVEQVNLARNYGARVRAIVGGNGDIFSRHPEWKQDIDSKVSGLMDMIGVLNATPKAGVRPGAAPSASTADPKQRLIQAAKSQLSRGVSLDTINQTLKAHGVQLTPQDVQ